MQDLLRTDLYDFIRPFNCYSEPENEYTPYNPHLLSYRQYRRIWQTAPEIPAIVSIWQSNIGSRGSRVVVDISENSSLATQQAKRRLQDKIYKLVYTDSNWEYLEKTCINTIMREGSCVVMKNKDGVLQAYSGENFNFYVDKVNRTVRFAFLRNGVEVPELRNLQHGIDLFFLKDPVFADYLIPPSRLDTVFTWLVTQNHALKANSKMFSQGLIGTLFFQFDKEMANYYNQGDNGDITRTKNTKSRLEILMDAIKDKLAGSRNANKPTALFGLKDIIDPSKNSKEMQFVELVEQARTRLVNAYSLTDTDLGNGKNSTYNNSRTFDFAGYDKIGKAMEKELDTLRNEFLLPSLGIKTTERLYIEYTTPENPEKTQEHKQYLEDYKAGVLTKNEYRVLVGLATVEGGDAFVNDTTALEGTPDQEEETKQNSFFRAKTPTEKALSSNEYLGTPKKKGFLKKWQTALSRQLENYLEFLKGLPEESIIETVELKPIETWYSFPALKEDLLLFASKGLDEIKKDPRIDFKKDFIDGKFPKVILDSIENRTEMLLKGLGDYEGVDAETTRQINAIIANNVENGISKIIRAIKDALPDFTLDRATVIAETEVANAIEGTRETMYLENFPRGQKSWQSVNDSRVRASHKANEAQGWIPIDEPFSNGNTRAGQDVRCRCTTLYRPA